MGERRRSVQRSRSCGKDRSLNWKTNCRGPARMEGQGGMEKLEYDFTLFLRLIATSIRFNQEEEFNSREEK